jgi:hypothetical protein
MLSSYFMAGVPHFILLALVAHTCRRTHTHTHVVILLCGRGTSINSSFWLCTVAHTCKCTHTHPYTHTHSHTRTYTQHTQTYAFSCSGHASHVRNTAPRPQPHHPKQRGAACRERHQSACTDRRSSAKRIRSFSSPGKHSRPNLISGLFFAHDSLSALQGLYEQQHRCACGPCRTAHRGSPVRISAGQPDRCRQLGRPKTGSDSWREGRCPWGFGFC